MYLLSLGPEFKIRREIPTVGIDGGRMTCDFTSFFNSISVISGRCLDDNERLFTMELRLRLSKFQLKH